MRKLILILILVSSLLVGCSTTKSLKEGEVFYKGERVKFEKSSKDATWKIEESSEKFANVYWTLWESPNGALLGMPVTTFFPLRLIIYHDFYNEKTKGFNYWVRENFGEPPKTIAFVNPEMKLQKGISVFEEYGHFGTIGNFKLNYNKKGNKAYIRYYFQVREAYKYRSVVFGGLTQYPKIDKAVVAFGKTSILKPTTEFNLYKIRSEKSKLVRSLQDSGFYFIIDKNIHIAADTTVGNKMLDLKMGIEEGLPQAFYQQQYLSDISIKIDSITQPKEPGKYFEWEYGKLKTRVLDSIIDIESNSMYSFTDTRRTGFLLSELGIFSNPRIEYAVVDGDSVTLNPVITLDVLDATKIGFNVKGNYKNTGYVGPSVGFRFRQLNVFHGAENLTVNGDVYYDFPIGAFKHRVSNSYGFSLRSKLTKPLLRRPFNFITHKYSLPKQFYKLNMEFNTRQDYFDMTTINASYGWTWKSKPNVSHELGLIDITVSDISNPTQRFFDLTAANPLLAATLINQFLIGSYYEFNVKSKGSTFQRFDFNYTGRVDLSGNFFNLVSSTFSNTPNGEQQVFGMRFAQFTRLTSEFVTNWHMSKTHQLVFRNITGVGLAYGNSENMPFIKQYFIGGTNSLRPFTARTVGPGGFFQNDPMEVNQVGDFKLEFNLEFRMPLVWKINLAVFSDMGNIWLLKPDPNRPNGEVRWNKLAVDSYLTVGAGLRLDMGYLVLRGDVGIPIHLPFYAEGNRWIWQNNRNLWAPVIGIGYPF